MSLACVSVIIPAYNYAAYIPYTLESVLQQEGVTLDIIVVDDGSTDETLAVLERYGDVIRVVHQENQGLSAARNTGLGLVRGEYIVFLDADDLLAPNVLASQCQNLAAHPEAAISICLNELFRSVAPEAPMNCFDIWRLYKEDFFVHLCHFNIAPAHAYMLRREVAEQVGLFDTSLRACEDHDYWLRCAHSGYVMVPNPHGLVYYRKHEKSMSANTIAQNQHDALLHERVTTLLLHDREFVPDKRLEAWCAHAAGCLVTAKRMLPMNLAESHALIVRAHFALKQAATAFVRKAQKKADYSAVFAYYALMIYYELLELRPHLPEKILPLGQIMRRLAPAFDLSLRQMERDRHAIMQGLLLPQALSGALSAPLSWHESDVRTPSRILLGSDFFWPSVGGCELFLADLGRQLVKSGYIVDVLCRMLPNRESLAYDGMNIISFDCEGRLRDPGLGHEYAEYVHFLANTEYQFRLFMGQPDAWMMAPLLHLQNFPDMQEKQVPISLIPIINQELLDDWKRLGQLEAVKSILKRAQHCFNLTESGLDQQFLQWADVESIFLPHALTPYPVQTDFRTKYGFDTRTPLLVHVGNFWPLKNQYELVKVLSQNTDDWALALVGHALPWPEEHLFYERVRALVQNDPRVHLVGALSPEEADAALAAADLVLLPSKAEYRPLVILQAMQHGRPWIATPECNSVCDDAGGLVLPLSRFPQAIHALLSQTQHREELGRLGRAHWEARFSWKQILPVFCDVIEGRVPERILGMPPEIRSAWDSCVKNLGF